MEYKRRGCGVYGQQGIAGGAGLCPPSGKKLADSGVPQNSIPASENVGARIARPQNVVCGMQLYFIDDGGSMGGGH